MYTPRSSALRQYRRDGTIHLICRTCMVTIAIAHKDEELDNLEQQHTCDPLILALCGDPLMHLPSTA